MGKLRMFLIASAIFLMSLGTVRAETFYAYLTGAQEVPAAATTATGYARVVVNEQTGAISFTVVFNGLSSAQTASHIHIAAIGANGPVAINFGTVGGTSGTITGTGTITPTQLGQVRQHLGYVNVHSNNFPGGEIRGQLGIKRPVDFDGDGRQDFSVLRFPTVAPQSITYWNSNTTSGLQTAVFGDAATDFPTPGDYDGDGKDDFAIYRDGATTATQSYFWILRSSDSVAQQIAFGLGGDTAVNRDFDGDGITDLAVFRPGAAAGAQAFWWVRRSTLGLQTLGTDLVVPFGTTGDGVNSFDTPVPGDYDGDGKFDLAVYRVGLVPNNTFIIYRSSDATVAFQQWGNFQTDYIVPGDYDGDGKFDFAAARTGAAGTSPLVWWILQSSNGQFVTRTFGISSDFPAQGDYDGDARTDVAVYRNGATTGAQSNFWVFRSFDNTAEVTPWGIRNDFAVARFDSR